MMGGSEFVGLLLRYDRCEVEMWKALQELRDRDPKSKIIAALCARCFGDMCQLSGDVIDGLRRRVDWTMDPELLDYAFKMLKGE